VCAVFKVQGETFRPGREVPVIGPAGPVRRIWAGFARSEILRWWLERGGELIDIPASEFAERSDETGALVWEQVPESLVIRALIDRQSAHELVKIVTRESTQEERRKFQHDRMPVLEKPLHATHRAEPPPASRPAGLSEKPPALVQDLLFGF
jgi:hypothetical protein